MKRLNNPDSAPVSPSFPWMIGNTLSNVLRNSIILSIFLMFPLCQLLFVNRDKSSLKIYQLWFNMPTDVTLNMDLSMFSRIVLADIQDILCSYELPPNNINIFFKFVTSWLIILSKYVKYVIFKEIEEMIL